MALVELVPGCPYVASSNLEDTSRLTLFLSYRRIPAGKFGGSNIGEKIPGAKIFLNCPDNWYCGGIPGIGESQREVVGFLARTIGRLSPRTTQIMGSSMGAYGALALGSRLKVDRILALAPEIRLGYRGSRSIQDVPEDDHAARFQELSANLVGVKNAEVYIGDLEPIDCLSASLAAQISDLQIKVCAGAPHEVAEFLGRSGSLLPVLNGEPAPVPANVSTRILPVRAALANQAAFAHFAEKDLRSASRIWRRIYEPGQGPSSVAYFLGRSLAALGDAAGAIECLSDAVKIAPQALPALSWLGKVYMDSKRPEEAVRHLAEYLLSAPNDARVLARLSLAHAAAGDLEAAEEAMVRAVAREPSPSHQAQLKQVSERRAAKQGA